MSKSTPQYPQGNRHAKSAHKTFVSNLKKLLEGKKGRWTNELPEALWTYKTSPRRATGESPFSLLYRMEAVIPAEMEVPSLRRKFACKNKPTNDEMLKNELDFIEKWRELALIYVQRYQEAAARYYNSKVRERRISEGELILRRAFQNTAEFKSGKVSTNWEWPYRVTCMVKPRVYELEIQTLMTIFLLINRPSSLNYVMT